MRRIVCRALGALDKFLTRRMIPVECFGWETLGHDPVDPRLGGASAYGRWHWPQEWREPFYRHNRGLSELAVKVRRLQRPLG